MPQMSPMFWFVLFIFYSFIFLTVVVKLHFYE